MACRFFEPQHRLETPSALRLPLIDEYAGHCHLRHTAVKKEADGRLLLLGCNHGNLQPVCDYLNGQEISSQARNAVARFSVKKRERDCLVVIVIEEESGRPCSWLEVCFFPRDSSLQPELNEICRRAQVLAFCQSYLARYPLVHANATS